MSRTRTAILWCLVAVTATATPGSEQGNSNLPANFGVVRRSSIYRGAQPQATGRPNQYDTLRKDFGVQTILKLNSDRLPEERAECLRLGIRLVVLPFDAKRIGEPNTWREVCLAEKELANRANWPVYVHCQAGQDRTGYIVGRFRQLQDGWKTDCVLAEVRHYRRGLSGFFSTLFYSEIPERLRSPLSGCDIEVIGETPAGGSRPLDEFRCAGTGTAAAHVP